MFHVIEEQGNCIIAKTHRVRDTNGRTGSTSPSANRSGAGYDGFWNGARWVHQLGMAMKFATAAQADQYLAKNAREM